MTLHEFPDVIQGTDAWHDLRRGIVTASTVGSLITPTLKVADNETSRNLTATLTLERITGWTEDTYRSDDMWRGVEHEPIARDLYSEHHAPATEFGFMLREEDGWSLGWSPDGLVGDDGAIEVKCPKARTHLRTILTDRVPNVYVAQCQAALLVSGRKFVDFVSFVGGLPLYTKRVHPDPAWFAAIEAACRQFEHNSAELTATYNARTAGLPQTERVLDPDAPVELKLS